MGAFKQIRQIAKRELKYMYHNRIYLNCLIILPIFIVLFFTTLMDDGQPVDLPIGIVDQDNTTTSRKLVRILDGFQTSNVVAHYANVNDARQAVQRNEIAAFLLIPNGTTRDLLASKQPKVSFYYSSVVMLAGSTSFKDLKTVVSLGSAGVGKTKLTFLGKTEREIMTFLQPITLDLHMVGNPWASYNIYLVTSFVPGLLMLFIFLITPYSLGMELKFRDRANELMRMADGNPIVAVVGKLLPVTLFSLVMFYGFEFYIYCVLDFPHPGGFWPIFLLGTLSVFAAISFGVFCFGLMPSMRMSMSICSLWAMLSLSMAGATYPNYAMDSILQSLAWLFPLHHYYNCYKTCIFNDFAMCYAWQHWVALLAFGMLPLLVMKKLGRALREYEYLP